MKLNLSTAVISLVSCDDSLAFVCGYQVVRQVKNSEVGRWGGSGQEKEELLDQISTGPRLGVVRTQQDRGWGL